VSTTKNLDGRVVRKRHAANILEKETRKKSKKNARKNKPEKKFGIGAPKHALKLKKVLVHRERFQHYGEEEEEHHQQQQQKETEQQQHLNTKLTIHKYNIFLHYTHKNNSILFIHHFIKYFY